MNKFPELKTLPTQEEIDELKQRNAELMAQVENLREVINHYQEGQVPSDNAMDELIHRANKTSPQSLAEHDREVAARAGRDGFIECYFALRRSECGDAFDLTKSADEYANKIKSGEVEL